MRNNVDKWSVRLKKRLHVFEIIKSVKSYKNFSKEKLTLLAGITLKPVDIEFEQMID